ncbi:MAG: PaaX family transcriptional regulator [Micromonosporaceae bacterium]|nr:PaaX family transcriptional regulator [Micromonosporaceae bacterium]
MTGVPAGAVPAGMPAAAGAPAATSADPYEDRIKLSRRFAAGEGGTRGLLLTILGKSVRPANQPVPTPAFVDVLGRLGVEEQASRQTLTRLAADGWLVSRREGRYARWSLTPPAWHFLSLGEQRIYGFDPAPAEWDGRWLMVLARVPESNRPARHLLRNRLRWAGFGSPAPAVWMSPHTNRVSEAEFILDEAGVRRDSYVFFADHVAGGELPALVHLAWDLDAIEQTYRGFVAEFEHEPAPDQLVSLIRLISAWRRLPLIDPGLPRVLLPTPWIGIQARELFFRQHTAWKSGADAEWRQVADR